MSTFKTAVQLAAGGSIANLIAGSKFEFLSRPAAVKVFAVQDRTAASNCVIDFTLGNAVVGDDLPPNQATGPGLGPNRQEDMLSRGVGAPRDRIQLAARETTGLDVNDLRVIVEIDDIA